MEKVVFFFKENHLLGYVAIMYVPEKGKMQGRGVSVF